MSAHSRTSHKKIRLSRVEKIIVAIVLVIVIWGAYSALNPQPSSTTTRTTLISTSAPSVGLAINGTNFVIYVRQDLIGGGYFVDVELDLFQNLQVRVPILNASVTLLNITTRDGSERIMNITSRVAESSYSYIDPFPAGYHICSELGPLFEVPKGATIRITIYIQDPSEGAKVIIIPRYFTAMNMPVTTTTSTCTGP
jgi:hypothetical protein